MRGAVGASGYSDPIFHNVLLIFWCKMIDSEYLHEITKNIMKLKADLPHHVTIRHTAKHHGLIMTLLCSVLHSAGEHRQTDGRTDGQTNATKCIISQLRGR